jgi:peptidyl-prolyl cis-trans isomerase A (cyclophilin A)/peptidyl-prolyl cis-trans isomerase B (cyclophilin B)
MKLFKLLSVIIISAGVSGCFQSQLGGAVGNATLTISPLHSPQTVLVEATSWGPQEWIDIPTIGQTVWDEYGGFLQLLLVGMIRPDTSSLDPDALYLVTVSGGQDYDPSGDLVLSDSPTDVQGVWHAIVSGQRIIKGNLKVSSLTEAIYQQNRTLLNDFSDATILLRLDAAAQVLVSDIDENGLVDYDDVLRWSRSLDAAHFQGSLEALDQLATAVSVNQPDSGLSALAETAMDSYGVTMTTNFGTINMVTLNWDSPIAVANFLQYVNDGFYTDVFFHRVIKNFMIQAGIFGLREDNVTRLDGELHPPIVNEARNGVPNLRGTVAFARTPDPDSASSQFFINHVDNSVGDTVNLDFNANSAGYTVFARLTTGLDVIDAIVELPVRQISGISEAVPTPDVLIGSVTID